MHNLLQQFPWEISVFSVLLLTFISFWLSESKILPLVLFLISVVFGIVGGVLVYLSLISIAAFAILTYLFYQKNLPRLVKFTVFIAIFALTILTFLHLVPGYNNWQAYSDIKLSDKSPSFPLWFNFDKSLIAFFLLTFAYSPLRDSSKYKEIITKTLPFFGYLFITLFVFGAFLGYVVFDPKLPETEISLLWIIRMLFFTVLAEELFFRFFLQNNIIEVLKKFKNGQIIGLIISSLLFGLFHFSGGLNFVILASISGFLYGLVYIRTKYLESAILLHFVINLLHFFLFSYPYYINLT